MAIWEAQLLHPTLGYKKWLRAVVKWVHIVEKTYKKFNQKKERLIDHLDMPQIYFSALYDSHVFSYEFNKGLECSTSSIETIDHLFIWAMRESPIYYLCLLSSFFSLSFFHFLSFFHAHGLCPYLLPRSPFWIFNLVGSFCLDFCLGCPFGFSN